MNANNSRDILKNGAITIGASQTNAKVSDPFAITAGGARTFRMDIYTGQVAVSTGITAKMQDSSGFNIWNDDKTATITASTDTTVTVDYTTGIFTATSHGLSDNDPIVFNPGTALPSGLVAGQIYFVKYIDANTFYARNSVDGSPISVTDNGSGTNKVTKVRLFTLKYLEAVSGDQTYLPLRSLGKVVVTTGSGDSVQFARIRILQED